MAGKAKDITGQKFGYLIALRPTDIRKWRSVVWEFLCTACGSKVFLPAGLVTRKRTPQKSCGCLNYNDISGQRFGKLTALRPTNDRSSGQVVWECSCSCSSGQLSYVTTSNLVSGGVTSCGCSRKGCLHHAWNPVLTDEERMQGRNIPGYKEWRLEVYHRDNFTCQKCGESISGKLNAHHVEGYTDNPSLRTKLSNGVTLCKDCHDNYHHLYGRNHATKEKFEEWMNEE